MYTLAFQELLLLGICLSYKLKCPEKSHWFKRAVSLCSNPSNYSCIWNGNHNEYVENCTVVDFESGGRKIILRRNFDAVYCSENRYQPRMIKYATNVSSNCLYLKSNCSEEGQITNDFGDRNRDVTCRCDYRKGYTFITKPRNPCFCTPSDEECSCRKEICPYTQILSPDYKCVPKDQDQPIVVCKRISNQSDSSIKAQEKIIRNNFIYYPRDYDFKVMLIALSLICELFIVLGLFLLFQLTSNQCLQTEFFNLPKILKKLSPEDQAQYIRILKEGSEKVYFIKVFILGKHGVGKTCLMRKLLKEDITDVRSTDGIDIARRCQINVDTGNWLLKKLNEKEAQNQRLARMVQERNIETVSSTDNGLNDKEKDLNVYQKAENSENYTVSQIGNEQNTTEIQNGHENTNKDSDLFPTYTEDALREPSLEHKISDQLDISHENGLDKKSANEISVVEINDKISGRTLGQNGNEEENNESEIKMHPDSFLIKALKNGLNTKLEKEK